MKAVRGLGAVMMLAATLCALPAGAQVYPSAPQTPTASDGTDNPGFVRVPSSLKGGTGGYVDVPGYASCRYVTTTVGNDATKNGEVIPVGSLATWEGYIGSSIPGETQVVCCRPKTVTLCQLGGAQPWDFTLPYTKAGDEQSPSHQCIDQWGVPYQDTQTFKCDVDSATPADGQWDEQGTDALSCSPDAFIAACTVSCGGGTASHYNSCGQFTGTTPCNTQACCTTDYVKTGCDGSGNAEYTDFGTCHNPAFTGSGGCTQVCGGTYCCDPGSRETTTTSGTVTCTYFDCGFSWHCCSGICTGCAPATGADNEVDYCTDSKTGITTYTPVDAGVTTASCSGCEWQ